MLPGRGPAWARLIRGLSGRRVAGAGPGAWTRGARKGSGELRWLEAPGARGVAHSRDAAPKRSAGSGQRAGAARDLGRMSRARPLSSPAPR